MPSQRGPLFLKTLLHQRRTIAGRHRLLKNIFTFSSDSHFSFSYPFLAKYRSKQEDSPAEELDIIAVQLHCQGLLSLQLKRETKLKPLPGSITYKTHTL